MVAQLSASSAQVGQRDRDLKVILPEVFFDYFEGALEEVRHLPRVAQVSIGVAQVEQRARPPASDPLPSAVHRSSKSVRAFSWRHSSLPCHRRNCTNNRGSSPVPEDQRIFSLFSLSLVNFLNTSSASEGRSVWSCPKALCGPSYAGAVTILYPSRSPCMNPDTTRNWHFCTAAPKQ